MEPATQKPTDNPAEDLDICLLVSGKYMYDSTSLWDYEVTDDHLVQVLCHEFDKMLKGLDCKMKVSFFSLEK